MRSTRKRSRSSTARTIAGLLILAIPAAVWLGAGYEELFVHCDAWNCGDRSRGWFLLVMLTAPLIPVGAALMGGGLPRRGALAALLRLVCVLGAAFFSLLGLALLVAATGVTESGDEASSSWLLGGLYCLAVAMFLVVVRRRLSRRYPSESWPRSDRSTSAG
jgi:MFS family permease